MVAHACNLAGGRDQVPNQPKQIVQRPYLKNTQHKRAGGVA
jgi:hypothetical protein